MHMVRKLALGRIAFLCGLVLLAAGSFSPGQAQAQYRPTYPSWQQAQLLQQQLLYRQWLIQQRQLYVQQLRYEQALSQQQKKKQLYVLQKQTQQLGVQQQIMQQPLVQPVDVPVAVPAFGAATSTWIGTEDLPGYGPLSFRFQSNGQVTMIDAAGSLPGTYTQAGNTVTLSFDNGSVVYTGTLNGQTLAGGAQNGKGAIWNFSVSAQ